MSRTIPLTLGELLAGFAEVPVGLADYRVTGLAADSRRIQPGDVFLAERGGNRHGLEFLEVARSAGALAVLWEPPYEGLATIDTSAVPLLAVPDLRQKLGLIASRFYDEPAQQLQVVGITGTDGKTSCAHFIAQALSDATGSCGLLGTLGIGVYGGAIKSTMHTTPDPLTVQHWLSERVANKQRYAVMEVSSHALEQGRVEGIAFAVAVLTHLTRDHLDYHGSLDAYAAAKRRLFLDHSPRWAVLNLDDAFGREIAVGWHGSASSLIGYGLGERSTPLGRWVWGKNLNLSPAGLQLEVHSSWGDGELHLGLLGRFNASNILASLATLLALNVPFSAALDRLARTAAVPGRMERLGGGDQPLVVIDYAHTPHALEQVLIALREHGGNRLWCVFGCGGDRDSGKRPLMGAVAEQLANQIIVTDDNPRTENPDQIIHDILAGIRQTEKVAVVRNRRAAIVQALTAATSGDIVLIAGKGHENYQIIGTERQPFSDRAVVDEYLFSDRQDKQIR